MTNKELKLLAKEKLNNYWGLMIAIYLVGAAISAVATEMAGVVYLFVVGPLSVGICTVLLGLFRKGETKFADMFAGFKHFPTNMVTGLLVNLFTFLWTLLFIIPGIVKSYAYAMTYYIQHDHPEMGGRDAINASQKMMYGHKGDLFLLDLSFIGWYLLVILTCGVLSIYVWPYHQAARCAFYEQLLKERNESAVEETAEDEVPQVEAVEAVEEAQVAEEAQVEEAPAEEAASEEPLQGEDPIE